MTLKILALLSFRGFDIPPDLIAQVAHRGELLFLADEAQEFDPQMRTVKIAAESRKVRFKQKTPAVKHRSRAEIHDSGSPGPIR